MEFSIEKVQKIYTWIPNKLYSIFITNNNFHKFTPGQFTRLGLSIENNNIFRAYSIVSSPKEKYLEFYYNVINNGYLTPFLAKLMPNDEIFIDKKSYGILSIDNIMPNRNLLLIASGTGLSPYISILRNNKIWSNFKKIIIIHTVKYENELGYKQEILSYVNKKLVIYKPIVTQEKNTFIMKKRLTVLFDTGEINKFLDEQITPENTSMMICGNPSLVNDMRLILKNLNFQTSRLNKIGHVIFEKYWQ
ncbi:Ferredoxin--NADP reductase [Candidatus Kinetoplastibacterium sorsogonicusi]|uniref:ferredoxin--NADP(+) reductase n=1 Tax=Candidatus Kinetoplastidibacterium kentomonadis TaxID=1576550 RepID=A0A3Q8EUB8_9PROT|nr:ferredoxin--NADP reductase [Candidatus Kinetoplastibacterium sorsogonicusi]AWD32569.1 Ferredoxin--NADP reductase [Candidatus Kinetoplastibacterium sorsogonicusi]